MAGTADRAASRRGVVISAANGPGTGSESAVSSTNRVDTPVEIDYLRHGGILPAVLRQIVKSA